MPRQALAFRASVPQESGGVRSQPCLRRSRIEQPVTSTAADYRLPAPQFLGRQPMLEINGLTGSHRSGETEGLCYMWSWRSTADIAMMMTPEINMPVIMRARLGFLGF